MKYNSRIASLWLTILSASAALGQTQDLSISELMAINNTTLADEDGSHPDWLEIHNAGSDSVDLEGWYLTDNASAPDKWRFPHVSIPPDGYLVVFASDKNRAVAGGELHTNFQMTSNGEYLGLIGPDGVTVIHEYTPSFPLQYPDVSYGIVAGSEAYMVAPSPGATNIEGGLDHVSPVNFSLGRGFYAQPFEVSLTTLTPDAEIRYTLDGSAPTLSQGSIYSGPIPIDKTRVLRAAAFKPGLEPSTVETQTYLFLSSVLNQTYPGGGWPAPGTFGPRNQLMDYDMDSEVINDPRYSDRVDDALLSLPTLSLVTDLTHLFNPSTDPAIGGIYANPNQDGSEWERPVSMELIHPDNTPGFQIDAGIRIRGGWSRGGSNPKHAFRFFFRSKYGESRLNYPLFGEEGVDSFDKIDLRCSTDYSWNLGDADGEGYGSLNTQTRDVFCRDTQRDMGQPYTRSRQYHVYLNGLYWGMYQSQERSEAAFAEDYLGGDESDYDAITRRSYSEGAVDGNLEAWTELWQKTIAGFTTDESYYAVQGLNPDGSHNPLQKKLVDLENLIDYMTIIYYTGSFDTPVSWWWSPDNAGVNNIWCLFNRIHPDGFKYFCHDCEHTLLAHLKSYPNFPWSIDRVGPFDHPRLLEFDRANPQTLHQNLLSHPAYRKIFQDRIYQHFFNDGALTPEAATARFQSRIEEIDLAIIAESARWGDAQQTPLQPPRTKDDDFVPTVNGIVNEFFPTRAQVVLDQLRARGWYPNAHPPTPLVDGFENRIGHVPTGSEFSLDNPNGYGRMYFTTDGSDPWVEPSQRRAVSFVAEDAIKQVLIPSGPLLNWNEIGFDDGAWTHGSIDRVLEFDGVDDSADFGTEPGSAGALTVAFWVYANHGDEYVILDKYPNDASGIGWRVRLRGDAEMQFRIGSSGSNTNIELDRAFLPRIWTHISCTFENGTAKVYFDGVERTSRSGISQSVQNISTPLRMGTPSAVDTGLKFEGRLNDVRLYDRALTPLEIADLVNHQGGSDGLTAHWKLDEASGETVSDSSGDGHVGTLFGNPVWRLASLGGIGYDQGTEFDTTIGTDVEVEMRGQNTSAYLRIPFLANTEDLGDLHFLNLRVKFDAGFVAYLNGQKVADAGSPATPEWNSSSPSERDDAEARLFRNYDLSSAIGSLVAGENLLALQGLNSASEDEDFLLSVELIGQDIHPDTEINPKAIEYSGPIDLFESLQIKSRVLDIGEWSPLEKATYSVGPVTESLRISEVHYHPLSASEAEFIELKNIGAETLQLNLVRFTEGIDFTFPSIALPPGELVVIVANLAVFEAVYGSGLPVAGVYSGRLDNAGERIRLEDALGEGILDFEFIDQWHPSTDGGNRSLTRLDLAVTDPENWGQEEGWIPSSVDGGTPGLDDSGPFESPTPSPTSTPSPTPSWTPSLTPTVTHSATSTPSESATWTSTPTWTPTPSDSPTPTPTASPSATATYLYDWTGEGDVNAMDLVLILKDLPNTEYLYGFAAHWNLLESR